MSDSQRPRRGQSRGIVLPVVLGVVALLALAGGAIVLIHPVGGGARAAAPAAQVQLTAKVQRGVVSRTITAMGSIAPAREVSASFAVSGTVSAVSVAVGQTVAAGAPLGTLDPTALTTALTTAENDLTAARAAVTAAQASGQQGDSALATAENRLQTAQNAVDAAQTGLAEATLTAPIAGIVLAVNDTVGSRVQAGNPAETVAASGTTASSSGFVTIADTSGLTMTAQIAEADIASVAIGQAATVTFPAVPQTSAPATVTAIAPTATSGGSTVSYATTVALASPPPGIRLGQTAELDIVTTSSKGEALSVPDAAITTATDGTKTVTVVAADGTTSSVTVTTGVVGDAGTEIDSGLSAGETVVIGSVSATQSTTTNQQQGRFGGGGLTGRPGGDGAGTGGFGARLRGDG